MSPVIFTLVIIKGQWLLETAFHYLIFLFRIQPTMLQMKMQHLKLWT